MQSRLSSVSLGSGQGADVALFIIYNAEHAALPSVDSLRMLKMHTRRPQDEVKVAVYAAQMTAPERFNAQDIIGVLCISLGTLMAVWLNASF